MKITKKRYLQAFVAITVALAIVRCVFPSVAQPKEGESANGTAATDTVANDTLSTDTTALSTDTASKRQVLSARFYKPDGSLVKNRIYSVPSFKDAFPDSNAVQLTAAQRYGVSPVQNRDEAERRMDELVYVASNPYYHVDKLKSSIPYLVPRAAMLLQDIGRAFFDSLQVKGIPLHRIIVTSVLRTKDDVVKLRGRNGNATENSCHLYGTTFDICYNRYKTVSDPDGPERRAVRNDTLKWVLSEVLRDFRQQGRCYIKYEVKQGCFHMTAQ